MEKFPNLRPKTLKDFRKAMALRIRITRNCIRCGYMVETNEIRLAVLRYIAYDTPKEI